MDGYFLAVYKELFGLGLKSVDLLIISQINEYQRKGMSCYVTNEQLSNWFGESVSTIERSIKKLSNLNIIEKKTTFIKGMRGKAEKKAGNRQREMKLNPKELWDVEMNDDSWNRHNEGSNTSSNPHNEGSNSSWNRHNDVTIDKSVNKTVSIKEKQNTDDADTDLGNSRSTSNTGKNIALKHYKSPEELPTDILQEILEGLDEHLRTGGTRGLNYKAIAKNYEIKQEYLDKDLPRWIKNILFNRECANRITNDSSTAVIQDGTSDESLSDYINEDEANEILDTLESCGDDKWKVMRFKQILPRKYGIPESVMNQYEKHDDFINELENIAA